MLGQIRTIVPQFSIVGMLLEHEELYTVVKSSPGGLSRNPLDGKAKEKAPKLGAMPTVELDRAGFSNLRSMAGKVL